MTALMPFAPVGVLTTNVVAHRCGHPGARVECTAGHQAQ